ncbi:uncharacterized protein EV420DRAFT_1629551 [Desarmillaria tabescens]|uniref:Amidohydrolase-related domain-containing protein n=1 Tax=Armillaria tabescens TaxID=1929756 RepID=A0AA39KEN3_ARMTA|nr:uncharacterized protein EV420DRAFT_1629551 [Desarmillaria tabescens]KAK0458565.1 hypothetical protein EV420DRAFT_1629551 [Desarmillaria tabescens]
MLHDDTQSLRERHPRNRFHNVDPTKKAAEWKDNIWPIRPQTPWDISTDFPSPRLLEYDVEEGTWLRLDVHPKTGDIVFDMIGDLYCISSEDAYDQSGSTATARPILRGVPYDSDPHFSPEGDRIVFRSDAELGVENIWIMEWRGCEKMDIVPAVVEESSLLSRAIESQHEDDALLARGIKETPERRKHRLVREGRLGAYRVTNETYRWVSDARFHPSGKKVIATKWYTSRRSLGAGEGWEYSIPAPGDDIQSGSGVRLVGRTLPAGFEDYGEQQIGPEQLIWHGEDRVIFSKNVRDPTSFTYSKDVHNGIYAIFERNLTSTRTVTLVDASPGGASRPELSRDGRTLVFVRRMGDHQMLVLKDLETGTIHYAWDGLSYDLSGISAPMGTYPSFAFTPSDSAIIIWAAGKIWSVPLATNSYGERISSGTPYPIRFTAHIEKRLAETRKIEDIDLVSIETADYQRIRAFKVLRADFAGNKVVFQAAGVTYVQVVGEKDVMKVPVLHDDGVTPYYSPSIVRDKTRTIILHARWDDTNFTSFELANLEDGWVVEIEGLPRGRYLSPVICQVDRSHRVIAFVKIAGDYLTGDVVASAAPGLYVADLEGAPSQGGMNIVNLRLVPSEIDVDDRINMRFLESNSELLVQQSDRSFVIDLSGTPDADGKPPHYTLATGKMSKEMAVSLTSPSGQLQRSLLKKLSGDGFNIKADNVAFVDFFHVYVAPGKSLKEGEEAWSKPGNATDGLVRLSLDGGHDVTWSEDGKKIFWFLGPYLHSLEVSKLSKCTSTIRKDHLTFGIDCVKNLLEYQEIVVEHSTDISRLKKEAARTASYPDSDLLVLYNATLLTMETGELEKDLVREALLVIRGGVITTAAALNTVVIPTEATVIDMHGATIVPGFFDLHAHWDGFENAMPAKSWEMETFLAVCPSASNVDGFIERSRVERGHFVGPRIFQVGDVIYGAGDPGYHQDIADMDEAHSALIRIKAEGGPISTSYKNYNQPSRASRQRLLLVASKSEHVIILSRLPTLYDDVLMLYAKSGTGASPTHLVNYGGAFGEQFVWATEDVPNDPKLRKFVRHDILEGLTESTSRPLSVAKMVRMGLKTHIGAHGEPPVYKAATSNAAQTLGVFSSVGSLSPGKLADFVVYPAGVDILNGLMSESRKLSYVARGGRIWNASTMEQVWPLVQERQRMPPFNPVQ